MPLKVSAPLQPSLFDRANAVLSHAPVWIAVLVALAVLQTALIFTHQPWADELQALLIASEAGSQTQLLGWLRYEGHPPGWYWLLQAIGLVIPFQWILPVAAMLCAIIVQGVILFASPFSRIERVLIASSHYILFEFLTISRGTSLGVALIFMALALWRSRWFWAVLAALPMVDFLFGVISGVFLILKWRERAIWWPGIAIWLAGSAFAGWSVLPASDMVSAFDAMRPHSGFALAAMNAWGWILKIGSLPIPFQGGMAPQWNTPVAPIAQIAWIPFVWLCWRFTEGYSWHRLLLFGFFAFTLAFSLAVYPIGLRHLMLGCALMFAFVWLQRCDIRGLEARPGQDPVWVGWLLVLCVCGLASGAISTARGFDSGDRAIAVIAQRGLSEKRWIALPEWRVPAISGRSNIAFSRLGVDCDFRFIRWDHAYTALENAETLRAALKQDIAQNGRGYLLSDMQFKGFDPSLIEELAHIEAGYNGIDYHLYVIGKDAPERASSESRSLPRCHALAE